MHRRNIELLYSRECRCLKQVGGFKHSDYEKVIIISIATVSVLCAAVWVSTLTSRSSLNALTKANVEALAKKKVEKIKNIGDLMDKIMNCDGGDKKCFSGAFSYEGFKIEGTWYKE